MSKGDERLLALWHALDSTERGCTKAQLKQIVPGYDAFDNESSFEKAFNRDKNALRKAGAIVRVRRYGVEERYYLASRQSGPIVELTPAELGAIRLAVQVWQAGDLGDDVTRAAENLTANAEALAVEDELSFSAPIPYMPTQSDLLRPLMSAIAEQRRVRFSYRSITTGKVKSRAVEPWRLAFRNGGWYLLGRDIELSEARAFRLSRITREIRALEPPRAFLPVINVDVSELLGETGHFITATLALEPGHGARLRSVGEPVKDLAHGQADGKVPAGFDIFRYRYDNEREFADELAGLGSHAVVLAPPQLKNAILKRLRSAAQLPQISAASRLGVANG